MKLWNIKTGAIWEGSPVDARELLARGGGWSKEEPVPPAPPEIETVEPIERHPIVTFEESSAGGVEPEPEQPREKRKYTRQNPRPTISEIESADNGHRQKFTSCCAD